MEENNFDEEFYFDTSTNDKEFEQCFKEYVSAILPHKFSIKEMNKKAEEYAETHDSHLRECLILTNLDLVSRIVNDFGDFYKIDKDDLLSQTYLDLVTLVSKYGELQENAKTPFNTYVYQSIRKKIFSSVVKETGLASFIIQRLWKERSHIKRYEGYEPTIEQVLDSDELLPVEERNKILTWIISKNKQSLDELEDNGLDLLSNDNLESIIGNIDLKERFDRVLDTLSPREEFVIRSRFGLPYPKQLEPEIYDNSHFNASTQFYPDVSDEDRKMAATAKTVSEVAEYLDLPRERILAIEKKALKKLAHPSRTKKVNPHLDYYSEPSENNIEQEHSIISKSDNGIAQMSDPYEDIEILDLDYKDNNYDSGFENTSHHHR